MNGLELRWHVEEEISLELDGRLPPDRMAAYVAHLAGCADCRALQAEYRTIHRTLAAPEPDTERQRRRSLEEIRAATGRRQRLSGWTLLAVAATVVLALVLAGGVATRAVYPAFTPHAEASTTLAVPGADAMLVVESGRVPPILGQPSPVSLAVDVRFQSARSGRLTLLASADKAPMTLATAILTRTTRVSFGGELPPEAGYSVTRYRVWLRLDVDGAVTESVPVDVRVTRPNGQVRVEVASQ